MKHTFFRTYQLACCLFLIFNVIACTVGNTSPTKVATKDAEGKPILTHDQVRSPTQSSHESMIATPIITATKIPQPTSVRSNWTITEYWKQANQIRSIVVDASGDLWTGGPGGVVHWDLSTNKPTIYVLERKKYGDENNVMGLVQTSDKHIWVGTYGNGLSRFDGYGWQTYTTEDGLPSNKVVNLVVTPNGRLWVDVATDSEQVPKQGKLGEFDGHSWTPISDGNFYRIATAPDNSLWVLTTWVGQPYYWTYTLRYDGKKWQNITLQQEVISAITVAPNGVVWVATDSGVFKFDGASWEKLIPPWIKDQEGTRVTSIAASPTGDIWFGLSFNSLDEEDKCGYRWIDSKELGVFLYKEKEWEHFTTEDGLVDDKICAIAVGPNGDVWFGSYDNGVSRFDGKIWSSYMVP